MTRAVLAVLAAAAVCVPFASGTSTAFPGKAGQLLFQSNRDGNYELYIAKANGSGVRKLLARPSTDEFNANWSPSGKKIVFQSGPPDRSTYDIWLANADGKGTKLLVGGATNDRAPQFCDETTVVFTRVLTTTNSEVFAIATDGSGLRRLTDHPASDSFPTCNPRGTRVAFISSRDGTPRIYEMTRTGGGLRPLTDPGAADPDYSADGKAIAYVALDVDRNLEVFAKNLATGKVVQRTNVKPPFEYRLPKFVPAAASRRAEGHVQESDPITATHRNTQSGEEAVLRYPDGTPVVENGSAASIQPVTCQCKGLDAEVLRATRQLADITFITIDVQWHLECTAKGAGGCVGDLAIPPPRGFRIHAGDLVGKEKETGVSTVACKADCAKRTSGRESFQIDRPKVESVQGVVLHITSTCAGKTDDRMYKLFFLDSGFVDRGKSDLNGNRVPDGKEK